MKDGKPKEARAMEPTSAGQRGLTPLEHMIESPSKDATQARAHRGRFASGRWWSRPAFRLPVRRRHQDGIANARELEPAAGSSPAARASRAGDARFGCHPTRYRRHATGPSPSLAPLSSVCARSLVRAPNAHARLRDRLPPAFRRVRRAIGRRPMDEDARRSQIPLRQNRLGPCSHRGSP